MMRGAMLLARRADVSEAARTDSVPGRLDGTEHLKYDVCMRVEIASLAARHPDRPQVEGTETHTPIYLSRNTNGVRAARSTQGLRRRSPVSGGARHE